MDIECDNEKQYDFKCREQSEIRRVRAYFYDIIGKYADKEKCERIDVILRFHKLSRKMLTVIEHKIH